MTLTESRRRANDKYDAANMAYQTVKIKRSTLDTFKALCASNGDKVNTVLRQAIEMYIADHSSRE